MAAFYATPSFATHLPFIISFRPRHDRAGNFKE